jgi:hypothetical protein
MKPVLKLGASLVIGLSVTACSTWNEPLTLEVCGPSRDHLKYKSDGHQDTTYIVAIHAGWDARDAAELAFYSQAPDDFEVEYSAPSGTARLFALQFHRAHLLSSVLHSLHGGGEAAVQARQQSLARMVTEHSAIYDDPNRSDERWKAGFLIHAMGDAYSHVWGVNQNRAGSVSYNPVVGHIPDGLVHGNPDDIVGNFENYSAYARALYRALDTGRGNPDGLVEYLAGVQAATRHEISGDQGATDRFIRATSTADYRSKTTGHQDCPAWAAHLDYSSQVEPFLEAIEARF